MESRTPDLSLVLPCYNEALHLQSSVARLITLCDLLKLTFELIFVDDGSVDGTPGMLRALPDAYPSHAIQLLFNERNLGRGATVTRGLEKARAPIAGFLDIDLEVDASYVGAFYAAICRGADLAIGRRIYKLSPRALGRFAMTRGYVLLRQALIGLPFEDTEAGYKFFRMETMRSILAECDDPGWFWDTEIIARAFARGRRIEEVRCLFVRRPEKTSTVRPFRDSWDQLIRLMAFFRKFRKPKPLG